jgi:hypothetical protein
VWEVRTRYVLGEGRAYIRDDTSLELVGPNGITKKMKLYYPWDRGWCSWAKFRVVLELVDGGKEDDDRKRKAAGK